MKHTKKQYEIDILEEQLSEINAKGMNGVFKYLKNKKSSIEASHQPSFMTQTY